MNYAKNQKTILTFLLLAFAFLSANAQYGSQTELIDSLKTAVIRLDGQKRIDILNQIAYYTTLSIPSEAESHARKAIELAKKEEYVKGQADGYQRLGIIEYRHGLTSKSIAHLQLADSLYHILADSSALSTNYRCLGNAYLGYSDHPTTLQYYNLALEYTDSANDPKTFATNIHAIGATHLKSKSDTLAQSYIYRARDIYKLIDYEFGIAGTNSLLADVFEKNKEYEKALDAFLAALAFYTTIQDKTIIGSISNKISMIYYEQNDLKKAREYADRAKQTSIEAESYPNIGESYWIIYLIEKKLGNSKEALKYLEMHGTTNKTLHDDQQIKTFQLLEDERRSSDAKQTLTLLEAKLEKQKVTFIWSLAGTGLALLSIILLLILMKVKKRELSNIQKYNQELTSQSKLLTDSNNIKNTLMDIVSHDINNPAGAIKGLSEILLEDDPENKYLSSISSSAERISQIVMQTSSIAVLENENLLKEEINLNDLIQNAVEDNESGLRDSSMKVENRIPSDIVIIANPIISTIFRNFIQNAVKYSSSGGKIELSCIVSDDNIKIICSDFGDSISEEFREKIFNRTTRLSSSVDNGFGLGLAISKQITEAHDGTIGVEPNKPNGNSFFIIIPGKYS